MHQLPLFSGDPQTPEEISRDTPLSKTLPLFQRYMQREGRTENTINAFLSDLKLFGEFADVNRPVGDFVTTDLEKFLHWLEYERVDKKGNHIPCSQKSYARRVTTLKVYFKWLHNLKAIPHNPADAVLQRSGPAPLSQVLSQSQIDSAIEASRRMKKRNNATDYRPEMLFWLLLDTGIKKGEAMSLKPDDIDRSSSANPVLTVRHKARNVYRERRIDLDPEWLKVLDLYMEQYHPVYDRKTGERIATIFTCTQRNLEYILKDIGQAAEIPFKLSFEVMRWTCAVRDYRMGMDLKSLREKMGLSEISWHETSAKIKQLAEKLNELGD